MATPRAIGGDVEIRGATEASYGTVPATGYTRLYARSTDLDLERPLGVDELIGMGRRAQGAYYERAAVSGGVSIPLDVRALGFWLHGLFGAASVTDNGDGTYDHVWSDAESELPSKTIEIGHARLAAPVFWRFAGCKAGSIAVPLTGRGPANADVQVLGQSRAEAASSIHAAAAEPALRRLEQGRGSITIGGDTVAYLTGGELNFTNTLEPVETIRDDGLIEGIDEGNPRASGSITVRLSDDASQQAVRTAIAAQQPLALAFALSDPEGWSLSFRAPRVLLSGAKAPIAGSGGISQTFDWQGECDASAGHSLAATLVNDVAGYV